MWRGADDFDSDHLRACRATAKIEDDAATLVQKLTRLATKRQLPGCFRDITTQTTFSVMLEELQLDRSSVP